MARPPRLIRTIDRSSSAVSSTAARRESRSCSCGRASSTAGRPPSRKRACRPASASRSASTSSGGATTPAPDSRIRSAAAPSGGTAARIGRPAARYSNTFPESTPLPRPPASGIRSSSASESRCSSSARRARRVRDQLEPVAEAERLRPLAVGRAEVADEAGDDVEPRVGERLQERPRVALAEERAGVGDPEARRRGRYSSPAKSSKSQPFAIVTTGPRGLERARLLGDRLRDARRSRRRWRGDEAGDRARRPSPSRGRRRDSARAVRVRDERVAQVGEPASRRSPACTAAPTRCTDAGGDRRDHGVDPSRRARSGSPPGSRSGSSSRSRRARAAAARRAAPASRRAPSPVVPCSSSAGLRPFGPT